VFRSELDGSNQVLLSSDNKHNITTIAVDYVTDK